MSMGAVTVITPALLRAVGATAPNSELYAPLLEAARFVSGDNFNSITSRSGLAMLVSQLAHESGYFSTLSENLNYSTEALMSGNRAKYFTPAEARMFGYKRLEDGSRVQSANQRMIANLFYGSRMGNHGVTGDDGWVFRGGGLIQLTGRTNFTSFGVLVKQSPELASAYVRTAEGGVASALWYWRRHSLIVPASQGDVTRCTEIIQGSDGGLTSRIALYKAAFSALG